MRKPLIIFNRTYIRSLSNHSSNLTELTSGPRGIGPNISVNQFTKSRCFYIRVQIVNVAVLRPYQRTEKNFRSFTFTWFSFFNISQSSAMNRETHKDINFWAEYCCQPRTDYHNSSSLLFNVDLCISKFGLMYPQPIKKPIRQLSSHRFLKWLAGIVSVIMYGHAD